MLSNVQRTWSFTNPYFNKVFAAAEKTMAVEQERAAFDELVKENDFFLDEQFFLHYCKLLAFITECPPASKNIHKLRKQALGLTAVFGTFEEAGAYVARFEKWAERQATWGYLDVRVDAKNLIVEACKFSLPEKGADLAVWRAIIRRYSPEYSKSPVMRLLPYAKRLETKVENVKAATLSELLQWASEYVWLPETVNKHRVLAGLFFALPLRPDAAFWDTKPKTRSLLPDIVLMGKDVSGAGENYYVCSLNPADPRALVLKALILGDPYLHRVHQTAAAQDGATNPDCGFYVLCKERKQTDEKLDLIEEMDLKNDPIYAYVEAWRGTRGEIVFKELYGYPSFMEQHFSMAADFFIQLSEKLVKEQHGVSCVLTKKKSNVEVQCYDIEPTSFYQRASLYASFAQVMPNSSSMNMLAGSPLYMIAMNGAPSLHLTQGDYAVIPPDANEESLLAYVDVRLANRQELSEKQKQQLEKWGLNVNARILLIDEWHKFLQTAWRDKVINFGKVRNFIRRGIDPRFHFIDSHGLLSIARNINYEMEEQVKQIFNEYAPTDDELFQRALNALKTKSVLPAMNAALRLRFYQYLQMSCPKSNCMLIKFALTLTTEEALPILAKVVTNLVENNQLDDIKSFESMETSYLFKYVLSKHCPASLNKTVILTKLALHYPQKIIPIMRDKMVAYNEVRLVIVEALNYAIRTQSWEMLNNLLSLCDSTFYTWFTATSNPGQSFVYLYLAALNKDSASFDQHWQIGVLSNEFVDHASNEVIRFLAGKNIAHAQYQLAVGYWNKANAVNKSDKAEAMLCRSQAIMFFDLAVSQRHERAKAILDMYYQSLYPSVNLSPNALRAEAQFIIYDILKTWDDFKGYPIICSQEFKEKHNQVDQLKTQLANKKNNPALMAQLTSLLRIYRDKLYDLRQAFLECEIKINKEIKEWDLGSAFPGQLDATVMSLTVHFLSTKMTLPNENINDQIWAENRSKVISALKSSITSSNALLQKNFLDGITFRNIFSRNTDTELMEKRNQAERLLKQEKQKAEAMLKEPILSEADILRLTAQVEILNRRYEDYAIVKTPVASQKDINKLPKEEDGLELEDMGRKSSPPSYASNPYTQFHHQADPELENVEKNRNNDPGFFKKQ